MEIYDALKEKPVFLLHLQTNVHISFPLLFKKIISEKNSFFFFCNFIKKYFSFNMHLNKEDFHGLHLLYSFNFIITTEIDLLYTRKEGANWSTQNVKRYATEFYWLAMGRDQNPSGESSSQSKGSKPALRIVV